MSNATRRLTRRCFLRKALIGAGALNLPYVVKSSVLGQDAPSSRIAIVSIGLGIQGTGLMRDFLGERGVQVVGICDVRKSQRDKAKAIVDSHYQNKDCREFADFREVCAGKDVDAVVIAAPDHWHALIGVEAATNGKHMYYEKPIGWSIRAGQALRSAVNKAKVVFQFGTQQRSDARFRQACELVRNRKIGELKTILVGVPGSIEFPDQPEEPVPDGFDYDMWLGPAPWAPYSFERCRPYTDRPNEIWTHNYSIWYHISDYCHGFIANWGIHHVDIAQWGHGTDDTGPVEIEGSGSFPQKGMADNALSWQVMNKFADGITLVHMDDETSKKHPQQISGFGHGVMFQGSDGWVFVDRERIDAKDKSLLAWRAGQNDVCLQVSLDHQSDFLRAIRTNKPPVSPVEAAVRADAICQIDNIAIKLKRKLQWDPTKEDFVGDAEASRMLDRPMRAPWTLRS